MKHKFFFILFFLFHCQFGFSQQADSRLRQWSDKHSIEKAWLHFDRDNYLAGETAWFKAYLFADYQTDTISTSLYVELLHPNLSLISRKILPILDGRTMGQFELPDTLSTGKYFIRAYTPSMLNAAPGQDGAFIFQRSIFVFGKKTEPAKPANANSLRLEFFPESGNFVSGVLNTIAFKASNEAGLPIVVNGNIQNDKGETVTSFSTYHDGMGMIDLKAESGRKYFAVLENKFAGQRFSLPEATNTGIVFRIIPGGRSKIFEIEQKSGNPVFNASYMIGQMQHRVVFRKNFDSLNVLENISGTFDVSKLASGILQVTVFNKDNMPLAERLCFVDNGEYRMKAEIRKDTVSFAARGKNVWQLTFADSVDGSFSVSVTDPEYDMSNGSKDGIVSSLLLTSDLKGYVHNPAYYFTQQSDSVETAMDLVMMCNGWRRFKWEELAKGNSTTTYHDPGYIQVAGSIFKSGTKKLFVSKPFLIFITGQDSTKQMRMGVTDAFGNFKLDSMLFFGTTSMLFKDIRGKKSEPLEIKLAGDTLTRRFQLSKIDKSIFVASVMADAVQNNKLAVDLEAINKAEGITLSGITLKSKKKTVLEQLEEKYTSALFSGMSERTIDLVNTDEKITQNNIFDYLMGRVPGLNISNDGPDYSIYYRQTALLSSMGVMPMTLYLDEVPTDASFIAAIPADQVALVKVFSNFAGADGNAPGGVLAIYTKKGADIYNSVSRGDMIRYQGYSVIKEFYAPDYSVKSTTVLQDDNRITLLWKPDINVKGVNRVVPVRFYNNDRSKSFKVVVAGMTINGKLLYIEKIISPQAF